MEDIDIGLTLMIGGVLMLVLTLIAWYFSLRGLQRLKKSGIPPSQE